jgi:general secretion pathway protein C
MKRLPQVVSFVLFVALCASAAYWAMQLFQPPVRPVAAPPRVAKAQVKPESAAALFGGGRSQVDVASNYQLRGVIVSGTGRESVAILSADGKPAQAIRVAAEVMPGVTVKEVHRDHVLLSEGGVTKRVELPESAKDQVDVATASPVPTAPARPSVTRPPPVVAPPAPTAITPQMGPPGMSSGAMPPTAVNPRSAVPPTGVSPGLPPANSATNPPPSPEPPPPATAVPGSPPPPSPTAVPGSPPSPPPAMAVPGSPPPPENTSGK